jgi:hypothetical protein
MRPRLPWIVLLAIFSLASHAQTKDARLMSEAEYKSFLNSVEAKLPEWQMALERVDPAKTNVSYAVGQKVIEYRNLGLTQIESATKQVALERVKRSVSRELWLHSSLQGIYDSIDAMAVYDPSVDLPVEKYVPVLSEFLLKIANDSHARVELLEKATCP